MKRQVGLLLFLLVVLASCSLPFKNLQGPPSEFHLHDLPKPSASAVTSDSALLPIFLTEENGKIYWEGEIPIDSPEKAIITLISPLVDKLDFQVISDHVTSPIELELGKDIALGDNSYPSTSYTFKDARAGTWKIRITLNGPHAKTDKPDLFLLSFNQSPYRISTEQTTFNTTVGNKIGIIAHMYHTIGQPVVSESLIVDLDVREPDGQEQVIQMHDDGEHGDGSANDGIYGASITATEVGTYTTQIVMRGNNILRTAQSIIVVVEKSLELTGTSTITFGNDEMTTVKLFAKTKKKIVGQKYKVFTQVWAGEKPIAWISGMSIAERVTDDVIALPLKMSMKWIQRAGADVSKIECRNAYVQDVTSSVPISQLERIKTTVIHGHLIHEQPAYNGEMTESMLIGKRPSTLPRTSSNHKVLLVHGYCTSHAPFTQSSFENALPLTDWKQGRSNDEFALKIAELGKDADSFSIVAHSQGGLASLHLSTFYWSHQDTAHSERPIQTLGSPFRGSGLAGTIASIGYVFGIKCGSVYDLTYAGASLWLTTIPQERRKYLWYATTVYPEYSWCNIAANAVLQWPNDGTCELEYGQLPGANNVGNKQDWCHSPNMKYPAQGTDEERNTLMNKYAQI